MARANGRVALLLLATAAAARAQPLEGMVTRAFGKGGSTSEPLASAMEQNSAAATRTHAPTIVVFHREHAQATMDALREVCRASGVELPAMQKSTAPVGDCHMPEVCRRVYATGMLGVSGNFSNAQLAMLTACLPHGAIAYVEPDARVHKMEDSADWHPGGAWFPDERALESVDARRAAAASTAHALESIAAAARAAGEDELLPPRDVVESTGTDAKPDLRRRLADAAGRSKTKREVLMMAAAQVTTEEDHLALLSHIDRDAARSFSRADFGVVNAMSRSEDAEFKFIEGGQSAFTSSTAGAGFGNLTAAQLNNGTFRAAKQQRVHLALWNLDRVDQANLPLDGVYRYGSDREPGTGHGVTVYVVDSGLNHLHQEFSLWDEAVPTSGEKRRRRKRRSRLGPDYVDDDNNATDCDGHGTHVAATAVGRSVGAAKSASVVGVRVLNCDGSGSISDVIAGLDWVARHHRKPAVATLSLGIDVGRWSRALEEAVESLVAAGVVVVVASGNSAVDACHVAPARVAQAVTVAATDLSRKFAPQAMSKDDVEGIYRWGNTGACVDIFAPGVDIYSACGGAGRCRKVAADAYTWASGTSMAVPMVAAAAAQYLEVHPHAKPEEVKGALLRLARRDRIESPYLFESTPNRLLYTAGIW